MANANNITLDQLQLALARVKNYTINTYSELGHTHNTSEIIKLTGFVMSNEGNTKDMRVAVDASDSLNIALGKLDRSIFNITENIGAIDVSNHKHDDDYYQKSQINQFIEDLEKADEDNLTEAKEFTTQKIDALINGAPGTLDTLKEIADSLNNDASLYQTISNMILDLDNKTVDGPDASTDKHIAIFDGTNGKKIKDSGYTIDKSVPGDAIFTDHNVQVDTNTTGSIFLSGCDSAASKKHTLLVNGSFYIDGANNVLIAPNFKGHLEGKADEATNADTAAKTQSSLTIQLGEDGESKSFNGNQATTITVTPNSIGAHDAEYTQKATDTDVENMLKELFPVS